MTALEVAAQYLQAEMSCGNAFQRPLHSLNQSCTIRLPRAPDDTAHHKSSCKWPQSHLMMNTCRSANPFSVAQKSNIGIYPDTKHNAKPMSNAVTLFIGVGRLKNLPAPKSSAKKVRFLGGRTRFRGVFFAYLTPQNNLETTHPYIQFQGDMLNR